MIHIATVHWQDPRWIDIQLRYLKRFMGEPFQVYAFLNGIPDIHRSKFFYSSTEAVRDHATKLNLLADIIGFSAKDPSDLVIFLDGDAFPIAPVAPFLREKLKASPLAAVQRFENLGDQQPHPCFCATTVGFWKSIRGDWNEGYKWNDSKGDAITDIGGNLLKLLVDKNVDWHRLMRSNKVNLHPLWFGVYGGLLYHHGAGFRDRVSRLDLAAVEQAVTELKAKVEPAKFDDQSKALIDSAYQKALSVSARVYESIVKNEDFYREFTG